MTTLPEEAVKAADIIQVITDLRLAILQDDDEGLAEHADPMVKAKELIAKLSALPFLSVQGAVKKLEWELASGDHYAEGSGTHYNIYETRPDFWNCVTVKPGNVRLATNVSLEDAKAAAQADYERRILAAIEAAPPLSKLKAENARLKAQLAEARKALDGLLKPFEGDDCRYDHHGYCQAHFLQEVDECCVKIARRALAGGQEDG